MRNDLSADALRAHLAYDPGSGVFTWRSDRGNGVRKGDVAGCEKTGRGYQMINFQRHRYLAHRLAWLYVTDRWPTHFIDHIDGDPSNNRFVNLREASDTINAQNRRVPQPFSRSQLLGAAWDPCLELYRSTITVAGRQKFLGRFATAEQAHAAYIAAKRQLHEGNTL